MFMRYVNDWSDTTADAHVAAELALFRSAEERASGEVLRFWETTEPAIILGRSSQPVEDVLEEASRADGVPIIRRFTGGGTVVVGPGCLNYALVLSLDLRPELTNVAASFRLILERIASALNVTNLTIGGETDLVLDGRKVSGSAQRRGRRALLHHGTLLYAYDPRLAGRYLKEPGRRPAYRGTRRHVDFLGNLPLTPETIRGRLRAMSILPFYAKV